MKKLEVVHLEATFAGYGSCQGIVEGLNTVGTGLIVAGSFGISAPLLAMGIPLYGLSILFLSTNACY